MKDIDIKRLIKIELSMQRTPRNLNTFWYMLWVWRLWNGNTDIPTQPSISNLRKRYTLSTTVLQEKLGIRTNDYQPYIDRFLRLDDTYCFSSGRSRSIKKWKDEAHSFFCKFDGVTIPSEIISKIKKPSIQPSISNLREMSGRKYHSTKRSPHRVYGTIQQVPKEMRQTYFPGSTDIDLVSCYGSMWWHILGGKECTLEYANLMDPQAKNILETKIMMDFGVDSREAKSWRSKLTAPRGRRPKTGIKWYDDLHRQIMIDVMEWAHKNDCPTSHHAFTKLEQETMAKIHNTLVGWGYDWIPMHDGVIVNGRRLDSFEEEVLQLIAQPHILKFNRW